MRKAGEANKEIIGKETLQWQKNISRNCGCANSCQKCGERKLNEKWTAGYPVKRKSAINMLGKGFRNKTADARRIIHEEHTNIK
jgi:hypothetical protein